MSCGREHAGLGVPVGQQGFEFGPGLGPEASENRLGPFGVPSAAIAAKLRTNAACEHAGGHALDIAVSNPAGDLLTDVLAGLCPVRILYHDQSQRGQCAGPPAALEPRHQQRAARDDEHQGADRPEPESRARTEQVGRIVRPAALGAPDETVLPGRAGEVVSASIAEERPRRVKPRPHRAGVSRAETPVTPGAGPPRDDHDSQTEGPDAEGCPSDDLVEHASPPRCALLASSSRHGCGLLILEPPSPGSLRSSARRGSAARAAASLVRPRG